MLPENCRGARSRPPLAQFTIALLLIKSKPSGLNIEDYIAKLRLHIKEASDLPPTTSSERHIDASLFWRDAFTKSLETQTALRIRIAELEQINRESTKMFLNPVATAPNERETRSKRKALVSSLNGSENRFRKTARKLNNGSLQHKRDIEDLDIAENLGHPMGLNSFVQAFLQQMFILQDSRSLPNPSAKNLAITLDQALLVISQLTKSAAETAVERASSLPSTQTHISGCNLDSIDGIFAELEHILSPQLRVMKSFLPLLLEIFDEIGHVQDGAPLQRPLTYNFTTTFKNIFQRICELATTYAAYTEVASGTALASQIHQELIGHDLYEHPPFLLTLCDFGLALVDGLDCTKAAHSNVMEGCLYIILREVGHRLRESVFGPLEHISEDKTPSTADSSDPRTVLLEEATEGSPAADSLYMIYILERFPSLRQAFPQHVKPRDQTASQSSNQSTRDSPLASQDSNSGKLISGASLRFQHTLLKAVFGEKQAADFEPSLPKPQKSEVLDHAEFQVSQEGCRNWFKREIWRLVGWEVLRSKLDT